PLRTQRLTAISSSRAKVAELADAQDSGSCGLNTRGGSSPPFRTRQVAECAENPQASVLWSTVASRPAVVLVVLSSPRFNRQVDACLVTHVRGPGFPAGGR